MNSEEFNLEPGSFQELEEAELEEAKEKEEYEELQAVSLSSTYVEKKTGVSCEENTVKIDDTSGITICEPATAVSEENTDKIEESSGIVMCEPASAVREENPDKIEESVEIVGQGNQEKLTTVYSVQTDKWLRVRVYLVLVML